MSDAFTFKYRASHRYWELALAGRADLWDGPDPLMHPAPQPGYYKTRYRDGWEPVMINSQGKAVLGQHRLVLAAEEAWRYCGANPVSYEAYAQAYETGRFPGEIEKPDLAADPSPGIGHNSGNGHGEIIEKALKAKGEALLALATVSGNPAAMSQAKADELANWSSALLKYIGKLDSDRKAEKSRFVEEGRKVDKTYQPVIEELRDVRDMISQPLTAFALVNPGARMGGQLSKKRMSARVRVVAHIEDLEAAAAYFARAEEPHLVAAIQQLANAAAKLKDRDAIPGILFSEETCVQ